MRRILIVVAVAAAILGATASSAVAGPVEMAYETAKGIVQNIR